MWEVQLLKTKLSDFLANEDGELKSFSLASQLHFEFSHNPKHMRRIVRTISDSAVREAIDL